MVRTGLQRLLDDRMDLVAGKRVAICCNHTAITADFVHIVDALDAQGVSLVRLFGPEHGVRATAQDMEEVDETRDPVTGVPTVSLYGDDEASLHPLPDHFADVDVVLFDIQDIGARYYTYQATLGFVMRVAGQCGVPVVVLDRPNPIAGLLEGNLVHSGFESFVGAFPIAVRHGLTMGELGRYFKAHCGVDCELEVLEVEGWHRSQWFDETGLPWVYPSPNMPTLDTATIYPGMCLFEATTWSEGRGTTRPFHLFGAPGVDPQRLVKACVEESERAGLQGVAYRPAAFNPGFQKHAGGACTGVEVHVTDRSVLDAFLLGLVTVTAAYRSHRALFGWRSEPYEFIEDVAAIDLLTGSSRFREMLESGAEVDYSALKRSWDAELSVFEQRARRIMIYEGALERRE
uniref:Uncharacterized protein conserved in bacteria n=1 Tax=uncultured delta proteobacterium HF0010_01J10 TaxID=710820 RepID=E0XQE1_9DELT|nr:uncharacterized protein conserved in bacteria [uncultured delta proteobacterium HF0010_01J10]